MNSAPIERQYVSRKAFKISRNVIVVAFVKYVLVAEKT